MWMPERSVRMKRLTFGFHRRVWCPKWTPLSSSWRMVTTAMAVLLCSGLSRSTDRPMHLVPGARPLAAGAVRPQGVDATRPDESDRALGTRSHPDMRGARPVYQSVRSPPSRLLGEARRGRPSRGDARPRAFPTGGIRRSRARRSPGRLPVHPSARRVDGCGCEVTPGRVLLPAAIVAALLASRRAVGPGHRGIDLGAPVGTAVRSPAAGIVAFAGSSRDAGSSPSTTAGARHNARGRRLGRDRRCG
jgi:hypothetical protein